MPPLVSCICPTTPSRKRFWPDLLRCFQAQSYRNIEMVIVLDYGSEWADCLNYLTGLICHDERIRVVFSDQPVLGDKRNAGCAAARGWAIAHLDDDDLYMPGHLTHLVDAIRRSARSVAGYTSTTMCEMRRVTVGSRATSGWWQLHSDTLMGGALAYRRDWWKEHRFESLNVGEDNAFIADAERCGEAVDAGSGELFYCLRNHANNVSGRCVIQGPDCVELPDGGVFA